ncbi:hypothetical protein EMIHUDRAFT_204888 [Emiliania huxleyi CCMP1516]|uniref:MobA-like NTP transferase domain-containing protein n=2 Tax=Emiliania huxleyi TaxID=2903 RepID=A0A0D3JWI9_EMIH1|nr:hypothetical protein EMIHUDRAFT_204888 [Emiliania huxleyi CCMP1516]EOD27874.1 hypothetical protein EMIHUDRAFT_204888 [Emiliania huxleyi CCMP1516]|eukprot:XP_005780303.1 hypothetical protein EMIHUDRAFT_204888 [Emiliania huxleyi CCMP1516]
MLPLLASSACMLQPTSPSTPRSVAIPLLQSPMVGDLGFDRSASRRHKLAKKKNIEGGFKFRRQGGLEQATTALDRMEHEYRAFEDAGPSERNDDTAASTLTRLRGAALDAGGNSAAAVTAIQLERLAAIIGVSMAELQGGLQRTAAEGGTLHASGVVARPAEQIAFEPVAGGTSDSGGVTTALLSVAARPSALDSAACPKALVDLGGQPVLAHVLSQLHAGGVRRVVLSCWGAPRGTTERKARHVAAQLALECVDLGTPRGEGRGTSSQQACESWRAA